MSFFHFCVCVLTSNIIEYQRLLIFEKEMDEIVPTYERKKLITSYKKCHFKIETLAAEVYKVTY